MKHPKRSRCKYAKSRYRVGKGSDSALGVSALSVTAALLAY